MSLGIYTEESGILIPGNLEGEFKITKLDNSEYSISIDAKIYESTNKLVINDELVDLSIGESKTAKFEENNDNPFIIPFEKFMQVRKRNADFDELYDLEHPDKED